MTDLIHDLFSFTTHSPTPWHSVLQIGNRLAHYGFEDLDEQESWNLKPNGKYFVERGGSVVAFIMPDKSIERCVIGASHTDSPCLKIKPHAEFREHNMNMFRIENYGGPNLSTWFDRDLAVAGQVYFLDSKNTLQKHLIYADDQPLIIPSLAIHLSERKDGKPKQYIDKQEHLCPLIGLSEKEQNSLEKLLKRYFSFKKLYSHDLFLVPTELPSYIGGNSELIAGYRLDNLCSAHAVLCGLVNQSHKKLENSLRMAVFWNHEEIGSRTEEGAASPFFGDILRRICISSDLDQQSYYQIKSHSLCLSFDVSHCYHPNFKKRYDPQDHPLFDKGPIIKLASSMRYASTAETSALVAKLCDTHKIPYQFSSSHSEIACGSTIGPVFTTEMGIKTLDLGTPLLAMHSTRELISVKDHHHIAKLMKFAFLENFVVE